VCEPKVRGPGGLPAEKEARFLKVAREASPSTLAALAVFAAALAIYLRTLLPGPTFGDWGEMQVIPSRFGVAHTTGYPLYVVLGKVFSLIPIGSIAWRADFLSAVAAAGAAAVTALIAIRVRVRPLIATVAGLSLAVSGTLWSEATFAEMNGLHLLLSGLVIHRAIVWRQERRDSDLLLGALLSGLCVANHALSITVVPIVMILVLVDAYRRVVGRPILIAQAALLFVTPLSLYAVIPIRALAGPPEIYGSLLTWDGFSSLVTGAQFRGDMRFGSSESLANAWQAVPEIIARLQAASNAAFVAGGAIGCVLLFLRDRWAAVLLTLLAIVNMYAYASYVGNLDHYLLVTSLVLAVGLAVLLEALMAAIEARQPERSAGIAVLFLLLPLSIATSNWQTHDQSANHIGEEFGPGIFAQLPPNAVLFTYWDALTNLSYAHCIDGRRPDIAVVAQDLNTRVPCDVLGSRVEDIARIRPVFALYPFDSSLDGFRQSFDLLPGPTLALPYGGRDLDHSGVLYRLLPKTCRATGVFGGMC
jgi:transmembrane protein TMEM260 (protein O-mannosyltransferase)